MSEWLEGLIQLTVWQYAVTVVMAFLGGWIARGDGRPPPE